MVIFIHLQTENVTRNDICCIVLGTLLGSSFTCGLGGHLDEKQHHKPGLMSLINTLQVQKAVLQW